MGSFKDLTGHKFGRLIVIKYLGKSKWLCKCDCGNLAEVAGGHLKNGYQENLTIDRVDNDKDYSPDNCRFITHQEQQNNKRNNVYTRRFKNWSVHDILFGRKR